MTKIKGDLVEILADLPKNWGKWGQDDEVGSLNYLGPDEVLRGVQSVRYGKTFTLMIEMCNPAGDPLWPGRTPSTHFVFQDKGSYESGKLSIIPGGLAYTDDGLLFNTHGSTHCDALAHTWFADQAWNGIDANLCKGGLERAGILPIAEKGITGHSILLDVARFKGVPYLPMHTQITLRDLLDTATFQGVEVKKHDIVLVRTGILSLFYAEGPEAFYKEFDEPGITYDPELIRWFYDMELPINGTDNLSGEQLNSAAVESVLPIHAALSRNLGVVFIEAHWLEKLAEDCAVDRKYDGLYVAAPLKIHGGTASPVNPIFIK